MVLLIYSIWDKVAEEAGPLFTAKSDAVAIRSYRIALRESEPSEHVLYCLGEFNTEKVDVDGLPHPREIFIPKEVKANGLV